MEFLVISRIRESVLASNPSSVIRQMYETMGEVIRRQKGAGKIIKANYIPVWQQRMTIYECDNIVELEKLICEMPAAEYIWDSEVYPLADLDEIITISREAIEAGDNIMPGGTVK